MKKKHFILLAILCCLTLRLYAQKSRPTLLSIADLDVPDEIQGTSFLPLLEAHGRGWRDAVYYQYYEYPDEHRVMPHFGIRTKRYKLIRFLW